jgi:superfamily II DNA or RNA helicase
MDFNNVYHDALRCIFKFLHPWDLAKTALVCKNWYRLIRSKEYRDLISYPFKSKFKLTIEQFQIIPRMMDDTRVKYKLVHGEVGSGKTWVAVAYMMYKYREALKCSKDNPPQMYAVIIVPPTCVAQWSNFFEKYTDIPVISGYESSCFYKHNWVFELAMYGVSICSNITSKRVVDILSTTKKPIMMLHDEAHNAIQANYDSGCEVVGFTASMETFSRRQRSLDINWQIYKLDSQTLNSTLPNMEFIPYEPAGIRPQDANIAEEYLNFNSNTDSKEVSVEMLEYIESVLNFGGTRQNVCLKYGKKLIGDKSGYWGEEDNEQRQAALISVLLNVPRMRQLLAVATLVKSKREKLIIFDINQHFIVHMTILLQHYGFDVYPFCTEFSPSGRVKILDDFRERGDILIGSIEMLSESHNITEANHITFARYPRTSDEFMQAFGRCHRYPQKKTVYVHMIFSCKLEMLLATQALDRKKKKFSILHNREEYDEIVAYSKQFKPVNKSLKGYNQMYNMFFGGYK